MFQKGDVEKIKTCFMFSFFLKFSYLLDAKKYCTTGKATDDDVIWRVRIACWITKATDTRSEYVILSAFPHCNDGCTKAP
jgi:hypothetical protein